MDDTTAFEPTPRLAAQRIGASTFEIVVARHCAGNGYLSSQSWSRKRSVRAFSDTLRTVASSKPSPRCR